jgi:phosphonate metabolism protein PhnN/1,5-bisphosphokinase (PRPP-forming)
MLQVTTGDQRVMLGATGGTLFLVVGPSGVGKDALIRAVHPHLVPHGFVFPRRWITTPDDRGEDHIPVSCSDFDEAVARGFIDLNWTAHGLRYGIPAAIRDDLSAGLHVIVNVSRLLIAEARARFPHVRVVHLTAPKELVRSRLLQRAREDRAAIEERMQRSAPFPLDQLDIVVFSNDLPLSQSADRFARTILAARCGI